MTKDKPEFTMPVGIEEQKRIMALVKEGVRCMNEIDVQKSDIKMVQEDLKDQFGMPSADATKYIKHFYDRQKLTDLVKDIEGIIANSEIIEKYNK